MMSRVTFGFALLAAAMMFAATSAAADRYHVHVGGLRTSGPSVPGDWAFANCYGTLAGALAAATVADSVLLYDEIHLLDTAAALRAVLANRQLQAWPTGAQVVLGPAGALSVDPAVATTAVVGVRFTGSADQRTLAALTLSNLTGTSTSVAVRGCTFSGFRGGTLAGAGGSALRATSPGNGAVLALEACTFTDNQTQGYGGAVWIGGGYTVTMDDCAFTANHTTGGGHGGAIMVAATSASTSLELADCDFTDNTSGGPGGALNLDSASLAMRRCVVQGSRSAWETGAFYKEGAGLRVTRTGGHTDPVEVLLEDCQFLDNQGNDSIDNNAGDGGAVLVKGGDETRMTWVEIDDCLFRGNTNAQGAGVYVGRFCEGEVRYCRFFDNIAWYQGGGAFKGGEFPECEGELATFVYCEFRGNRAGYRPDGTATGEYSRGGGLAVRNHPRAYVYNCTFVDNRVNDYAYAIGDGFAHALEGGQWTAVNRCKLVNCAFWGTGGDIQVRSEGTGGMELVSHAAVAAGQMSVPGTTPVATVWLTAFPFVAPQDLRPAIGSPLIDAGEVVPFAYDLAGLAVPFGPAFDIGCYEDHGTIGVTDPPPAGASRLAICPNPFNPRTSLAFALADAGLVEVAIHDARGRLVRRLCQRELPAGDHALAWDGCDDHGQDVAAGIYLARLHVDGHVCAAAKMSLVR